MRVERFGKLVIFEDRQNTMAAPTQYRSYAEAVKKGEVHSSEKISSQTGVVTCKF